jgi:hypothetical protein
VIVRGLFHLHTEVSKDATLTHADYVRHARERGHGFLLLGEHRDEMTDDEVREAVARCDELSTDDLLLVPGQEQQTEPDRLHIVGIGVREPLREEEPAAVVAEIARHGGVSVLAHPFRYRRLTLDPAFLASLDGIEGWNLRYDGKVGVRPEVRDLLAGVPEAVGFAGLDAHDPPDLEHPAAPVLAVEVDRLTEPELLAALRAGRFTIESGGEPLDLAVSGGARAAAHRGLFAVARGMARGLRRIGIPLPESWVRGVRRRF